MEFSQRLNGGGGTRGGAGLCAWAKEDHETSWSERHSKNCKKIYQAHLPHTVETTSTSTRCDRMLWGTVERLQKKESRKRGRVQGSKVNPDI